MTTTTVGVLHPGEMGAALASGLRSGAPVDGSRPLRRCSANRSRRSCSIHAGAADVYDRLAALKDASDVTIGDILALLLAGEV